ncbi:MAG: hypothetical protein LBL42_06325 [Tannerella sp.]|jgi:hypothetical protein|nr:hypothetical protein [Tannerella sp.]
MPSNNYYPRNEPGFIQWCIDFFLYLASHLPGWGLDPTEEASLKSDFDTFQNAYNHYHDPDHKTPANRVAKDTAKKGFEKRLRAYVKEHLAFNHLLTDADRRALGINVPEPGPHPPHPLPTSFPILTFGTQTAAWLYMHLIDSVTKHRAKPFGVQGAEYRCGICETPPVNPEDLPEVGFITRWPHIFKFRKEDSSKIFCVCARWENTRGEKGPWSEIYRVIIP